MVIKKYPQKSVSASFSLNLNDIALKRVKTIKYLGISIDETLTWSSHITQLTLRLFIYAGLFYSLRSYVGCETHRMLYYNLVYSKIQYGILL